jgi:hypothetical protein
LNVLPEKSVVNTKYNLPSSSKIVREIEPIWFEWNDSRTSELSARIIRSFSAEVSISLRNHIMTTFFLYSALSVCFSTVPTKPRSSQSLLIQQIGLKLSVCSIPISSIFHCVFERICHFQYMDLPVSGKAVVSRNYLSFARGFQDLQEGNRFAWTFPL